MSQPANASSESPTHDSSAVLALIRFLRMVRLHQKLMVLCFAIACVLGGVYYTTATRIYEASGSIQVVEDSMSVMESHQRQTRVKDYMPSYLNVLRKPAVLDKVINSLGPAQLAEFGKANREAWPRILSSRIYIRNPLDTNILELYFKSPNPDNAAIILEAVINNYIEFIHEKHKGNSQQVLVKLTAEREELEASIEQKTAELIQLKGSLEEFDGGEDGRRVNIVVDQLMKLNNTLSDAQNKTLDAHAKFLAIDHAVRNNEDILQFAIDNLDALGTDLLRLEFNLDQGDLLIVARLNEELLRERSEKFAADRKFGANHPMVLQLNHSIMAKEQRLATRLSTRQSQGELVRNQQLAPRLLQMAQQRYKEASSIEQALRSRLQQYKQAALNLNVQMAKVKQIEADLARKNSYNDVIMGRMKDVELGKDSGTRIHVLGHPEPPTSPVSPRLSFVGLGTIAGGVGIGFAVIYVLTVLDDRFRSLDELQTFLGAPVLTTVPRMQIPEGNGAMSLITVAEPTSVVAEAYRTLRTGIVHQPNDTSRLVVTSSEPSDGKTTSVGNLAAAFAQSGKRTILIDADLRRPGMTKLLGLRGHGGLSTILESDEAVEDVVRQVIVPGIIDRLDVISAGPRPANPAELLSGERFMKLLSWAEAEYDQILIDAPPVLAVTDATVIGRLADGIVLVVRPEKNSRRMVIRAGELIASHGCTLLGTVVNRISTGGDSGNGYEYGYGYGYNYSYSYGHDASAGLSDDFDSESDDDSEEFPATRVAA
ncbi:MAG: polysaccharide biosynthesis tyrosine autokinase [Planctomycetota bacterium]|nr:polysaccharide biosynthesis tyrosine autokinase [Planctomycetota bacterium]